MILFRDYVVIEPLVETKTSSGIILTKEAESRQLKGRVVEIGVDVDIDIKEDDVVVFDKLNSSPCPEEIGSNYLLCMQEDIICKL